MNAEGMHAVLRVEDFGVSLAPIPSELPETSSRQQRGDRTLFSLRTPHLIHFEYE